MLILLMCAHGVLYAGNVIVKGQISNRLAEQITFSTDDGWLEYTPIERTATLDKEGRFSVVLPVAAGYAKITLEHGDQSSELYLKSLTKAYTIPVQAPLPPILPPATL